MPALSDAVTATRQAAATLRAATAAYEKARAAQAQAAVCLVRQHGARPVEVQRRMGLARNQRNEYVRIMKRHEGAEVPTMIEAVAWRTLDRTTAKRREQAEVLRAARERRDAGAQSILDAGGRPMDVCEATGLTSSAVAQMGLRAPAAASA